MTRWKTPGFSTLESQFHHEVLSLFSLNSNHVSLTTTLWSKSFLSHHLVCCNSLPTFSHTHSGCHKEHSTSECFPQIWPCYRPTLKFFSSCHYLRKDTKSPIYKASSLIFYVPPASLVCTSATLTLTQVFTREPHTYLTLSLFLINSPFRSSPNYVKHLSGSFIINLTLLFKKTKLIHTFRVPLTIYYILS